MAAKRVFITISAALACGMLVAGGGYAVERSAFDLWGSGDPNAPKRIGDRVEVAATDDSTVYAWNSTRWICVGISVHDRPAGEGCGMPVIGAPGDSSPAQPPPRQVVGFLASSPGLGDTSTYVVGPTSRSVARVTVEVRDGRVLETQTHAAPDELKTRLRFYAIQIPNAQPTGTAAGETPISPIRTIRAYSASGVQLGSISPGA